MSEHSHSGGLATEQYVLTKLKRFRFTQVYGPGCRLTPRLKPVWCFVRLPGSMHSADNPWTERQAVLCEWRVSQREVIYLCSDVVLLGI